MGEQQGHEFRGNQYSGGGSAGKEDKEKFQKALAEARGGVGMPGAGSTLDLKGSDLKEARAIEKEIKAANKEMNKAEREGETQKAFLAEEKLAALLDKHEAVLVRGVTAREHEASQAGHAQATSSTAHTGLEKLQRESSREKEKAWDAKHGKTTVERSLREVRQARGRETPRDLRIRAASRESYKAGSGNAGIKAGK